MPDISNQAPSQESKGHTFAALHVPGQPLLLPNPWDVGSAVMLGAMGFKALATTSAGYAFSAGQIDGSIRRDEMLAHATHLLQATELPVSADLENGYGAEPEAVAHTVSLAFATGLVGASIEDASGNSADPIYDIGLARERIAAAAQITKALPSRFMLCARAENYLHGRADLADTITRLQAFQDAGADLLYAPGLKNIEDVRSIVSSVDLPVNVIATPSLCVSELADAGVARISVGSAMARAAYGAMIRAADELMQSGSFAFISEAPGFAKINQLLERKLTT